MNAVSVCALIIGQGRGEKAIVVKNRRSPLHCVSNLFFCKMAFLCILVPNHGDTTLKPSLKMEGETGDRQVTSRGDQSQYFAEGALGFDPIFLTSLFFYYLAQQVFVKIDSQARAFRHIGKARFKLDRFLEEQVAA